MQTLTEYVEQFVALRQTAAQAPLPDRAEVELVPKPRENAPLAVIVSPHPDDEVVIGGWALRLMREAGWRIVVAAVTLGSLPQRRSERLAELKACCGRIGFELALLGGSGLENINLAARRDRPEEWSRSVGHLVDFFRQTQPKVIFYPHSSDFNRTHIGVNALVQHALLRLQGEFACHTVETEYWAPMESPNILVEIAPSDVGRLLSALSCHVGEIRRNPYHLNLPAWMMDNVRRGAELVGGQGGHAPAFYFGTLFRWRYWDGENFRQTQEPGRFLSAQESPNLFG